MQPAFEPCCCQIDLDDVHAKFGKKHAMALGPGNQQPVEPAEFCRADRLEARSEERRKSNPKFQKRDEMIKKYVERKARHQISLNEEKFRSEVIGEDDPEKKEEEKEKKEKARKRYTEHVAWEPDFYNDEIVNIVADYLTLGSKALASAPVRAATDR